MSVFANLDEARRKLAAAGFKNFKDSNKPLSGTYLDDYAGIGAFLCDQARFTGYLEHVSANLWDLYNRLPDDEGNKFTRSLGSMANDLGFAYQSHLKVTTDQNIVLITGDEPKFGTYVRGKLFWKDSMDGRHGEHTHSLQWLTIAYADFTQNSAADLYAKSVDYRCTNSDGEVIYLWSWLVDCFPEDMKGAATKIPGGDTLGSNSFRAPQYVMDYLMIGPIGRLKDHFVAQYLYWRYRNRNWLKIKVTTDPETYAKQESVTSIQEGDLKEHGRRQHAGAEWTKSVKPRNGAASKEAPVIRSFSRAQPSPPKATPLKLVIPIAFHNREGSLRFGHIE